MTRRPLAVVPLGVIGDRDLPGWLASELNRVLTVDARLEPALQLRDEWLHPDGSGRYQSNRIVDSFLDTAVDAVAGSGAPPGRLPWTLVITAAELVAPGRDFVFGEATVGGPVALISVAGLGSADASVLRRRTLKEAAHEIGHLAGLAHCDDPRCVMFPSADLLQTDAKLASPCDVCREAYPTVSP